MAPKFGVSQWGGSSFESQGAIYRVTRVSGGGRMGQRAGLGHCRVRGSGEEGRLLVRRSGAVSTLAFLWLLRCPRHKVLS